MRYHTGCDRCHSYSSAARSADLLSALVIHAVPWLWRIHRVHHADPEIDVSTALRFHPVESLLSMVLKAGVVLLLLGMPPGGVLVFEITLNAAAMFNHTNASLPQPWSAGLGAWP